MSRREALYQRGKAIQDQLQHQQPPYVRTVAASDVPGVPRLVTEVAFGAVWSRPGLSINDRMICTLAVLSSVSFFYTGVNSDVF